MTQQTTCTLHHQQTGFVAGLHWQYLPLRGARHLRLRAKEAHASHWATLLTGDGKAQGALLGTVALSDRPRYPVVSLALAVLPALPAACYGVFPLPGNQYWFVAVRDGTLSPFGDVVGNDAAIRTAVSNFLHITSVPAAGWTVYAPPGFFSDRDTEDKALSALLEPSAGRRAARLHNTHNSQGMWLWGIAVVSLGVGVIGYSAWQAHQENARIAAAQAALRAKQQQARQAPADTVKPWATQPALPALLSACSTVWKAAPISLAGWVFNTAMCEARGHITLHYSLPKGGTVGDFAQRLPAVYGPEITPGFNIPGSADDAAFTLPVPLTRPEHPETLLPGDQQIQHLTSYAQRITARLRLSEQDSASRLTQGEANTLPWRTYNFTFITDIPPDRLFAPTRFDSRGIRATRITTTLKNNRLEYTIEGLLYANR
ncbi:MULTISPECIES: type 4b pilus protein PilO2 [unclassified Serratia (in: enterobacteria)]|uniref:type 4b pilus protein PilO2 n=1 Tax=unclassified Serratia (in: enterobacteria) TaxID=2647522 RepID=UPI0030767CBA